VKPLKASKSVKVANYFAKNKPKGARSRLFPHRVVILELHSAGFSLRQVCEFLKNMEGVKITPKNLSIFIYKMLLKPIAIPKISSTPPKKINEKVAPTSQTEEDWMPKIKSGFGLFDP